jgi:hypothetical protein
MEVMMSSQEARGQQPNPISQQVQTSLQKASAHRERLRSATARYGLAGIILSALATFFAGLSSLLGTPLVLNDWRITCSVAAVFTLAATIVGSVQSQFAKPELLTQASECVGKLRALLTDTLSPSCDWEEIRKKYQQVLVDYSAVDL